MQDSNEIKQSHLKKIKKASPTGLVIENYCIIDINN